MKQVRKPLSLQYINVNLRCIFTETAAKVVFHTANKPTLLNKKKFHYGL